MAGAASVGIEVTGAKAIGRALRLLGEAEAPFLREALEDLGPELERETSRRAPAGIARTVDFVGVRGRGATMKATVTVRHPGAKSREFGRTYYYRGFTGRRMKATGSRFKSNPGQRAEPFAGILHGNQAIGAVAPRARERIEDAIEKEWERVAGGPD